jgi:tetratricopeptide (TPR) repeat protein
MPDVSVPIPPPPEPGATNRDQGSLASQPHAGADGVQRFSRSAEPAIQGFRYQALVTLKHVLFLRPSAHLMIEGTEDIVLVQPPLSGTPPVSVLRVEQRLQVKHTTEDRLRWTDERVYASVLEFLVQYDGLPTGTDITFSLVTPALVGGVSDTFIPRWKQGVRTGNWEPAFADELAAKLQDRLAVVTSMNLRAAAGQALKRCQGQRLLDFASRVKLSDTEQSSSVLADSLACKLAPQAQAYGLTAGAALSLLVENILYRATLLDPAARMIDVNFVATALIGARDQAAAWEQFAAETNLLGRVVSAVEEGMREIANRVEVLTASVEHLAQGAVPVTLRDHAVLGSGPTSAFPLGERISGRQADHDLVELIARGQYTRAVALIDQRLAQADQPAAGLLHYLKACAYAGFNPQLAQIEARSAAHLVDDPAWTILLTTLAQFYAGDVNVTPEVANLVRSPDRPVATIARILLADIAYRSDEGQRVLELVEAVDDPRAIRLTIRGYAEVGNLDMARAVLDRQMPRDDPEYERLETVLAFKQFFRDLPRNSEVLPADIPARCARLQATIQRALAVCPPEAIRKRQELLANSGLVYTWTDSVDEASACLEEAIGLDRTLPHPHIILASIHLKRGHLQRATASARAAVDGARHRYQAALRSDGRLLLASLAMRDQVAEEEAERLCVEILSEPGIAPHYFERARMLQLRLRLYHGHRAEARQFLMSWQAGIPPEYRTLGDALVAHWEERHQEALVIVDVLLAAADLEIHIRYEARLIQAASLMNLRRFPDAAAAGERALAMGMGTEAAEVLLEAYAGIPNDVQATALEDRLLGQDSKSAPAWRSRWRRSIRQGNLQAALTLARQVAGITGAILDVYNAAAVAWNLGREDQAAELILPVAGSLTAHPHVNLAACCMGHRQQWVESAEYVLAHLSQHPQSKEARRIAVAACTKARLHVSLPEELDDKVTALLASEEAFDQDLAHRQYLAGQRAAAVFLARYRRQRLAAFQLAKAFRISITEAVQYILNAPDLHFHAGDVWTPPRETAIAFGKLVSVLFLDLPSAMLLSRMGLLGALAAKWKLRVSVEQMTDFRNYRGHIADLLAAAERGHLQEMTETGMQPTDSVKLRMELAVLDVISGDLKQHCDVVQLAADPALDALTGNTFGASQLRLAGRQFSPHECLVIAESPLNRTQGISLSLLVYVASVVLDLPPDRYFDAMLRGLALGVHRLNIPAGILDHALQRDDERFGPSTRLALAHLRNGGWFRGPMLQLVVFTIMIWASDHKRPIGWPHVQAIAAVLHGRSFKRKVRHQTLRKLPCLVDRGLRNLPWEVRQRGQDLVNEVQTIVLQGDRLSLDTALPNCHRAAFGKP